MRRFVIMGEPRTSRVREAVRFLTTAAVGGFGIYWGHRTPGAGLLETVGVVIIISAPIQLILRLRGWPGLNAMLHQHDRPSDASVTAPGSSSGTDSER